MTKAAKTPEMWLASRPARTSAIAASATAAAVRVNGWSQYTRLMDEADLSPGQSATKVRKAGVWVVAAFWLVQFVELTIVGLIQGAAFAVHQLPERIVVVVAGMLLSALLVETSSRLEGRPFRSRMILTLAAALAACAALNVFAYQVAKLSVWGMRRIDPAAFVYVGFAWSWFFLSVAAALLALSYSREVRDRGERLSRLEIVARDARIAALRYQINPHFLFNSLNSVAGLIASGGAEAAEAMVVNLADFLRATLELDPVEDIPLGAEFELQRRYLAIEQARFPSRLVARMDLPRQLATAPVPALIIQPLIENSIQHAVARSTGLVTLIVTAYAAGGWLIIRVEDDGGTPTGRAAEGTGIGLRNVRDRLAAKYGSEQSLTAEPLERGGFRSEIRVPAQRL